MAASTDSIKLTLAPVSVAPLSSSIFTISWWPPCLATTRGVEPPLPKTSTSTPSQASSRRRTPTCPPFAAIHTLLLSSINSFVHFNEEEEGAAEEEEDDEAFVSPSPSNESWDNPHAPHSSSKTSSRPPPDAIATISSARFLSCP